MTTAAAAAGYRRNRVAAIVGLLIVAAAALLVVGVITERHTASGDAHPAVTATTEHHEDHHGESAQAPHAESAPSDERGGEAPERATGVNLETPWLVALGTLVSISCAVAVWRRPTRPVIALVVAITVATLVLDAFEIRHQIDENRFGLATLAVAIVVLRAAAIAGAAYLYRSAPASR